jgi:methylmalonyl-CoA mutase
MTGSPHPLAAGFEPPSHRAWLLLVEKVLKRGDFEERLVSRTADGLAIQPLYARAPTTGERVATAGLQRARGSARTGWDARQRHGACEPKRANAAILADLEGGVSSIELQITAPGQAGLHYGAESMAAALEGVLFEGCTIALDARENTLDAAGSLMEIWREKGIGETARLGAFNLDPLGVLAETGTLYYAADRSCEIAASFAAGCLSMPHVQALLADGRPYHEAGASEAQELAAMLATLVAYLRACEVAGLLPRQGFGKIALALAADADLFLTIAKLRAARKLVARVASACGEASAAASMHLSVTTSERMMARRDPWVNILRTTVACAGAAFGGADAITVLPFTSALGQPDAFAHRLARNTHVVLQEEAALGRVHDPAGGAFFVEQITDDLAAKAWALFQSIDARGGIARALEEGSMQEKIAKVAEARARDIASGRLELTGVSAFPSLADDGVKADPLPPADPVVKGGACVVALTPHRLAAPYEMLRDAADAHVLRVGKRPQIFLAGLGDLATHSARSTWTRNFLAAGGIDVIASDAIANAAAAGKAFAASGAAIACLCSSDNLYAEFGAAAAAALVACGAKCVLLAGRPMHQEAALRAAGVELFIHRGCDAIAVLTQLHAALDVGR